MNDIIKYQLLNSVNQEDNVIIRILSLLIFYQVGELLSSYFTTIITNIIQKCKILVEDFLNRSKKENTITYKRIIHHFMKDGTKNELYKAFDYFFTSYIKYNKELELLVCSNDTNIKYQLDFGNTKEIKYKYENGLFTQSKDYNCKVQFKKELDKISHYDGDLTEQTSTFYTIYFIMDKHLEKDTPEKYLEYINQVYIKHSNPNSNQLLVYRNEGTNWILCSTINKRKWNSLFVDKHLKEQMINTIYKFKNKELYIESGNIWKKIQLCHGLPGTGKTSYIKCVASELNRNIYLLDLSQVNNNTIIKLLSSIKHDKSLIAIEDIDAQTDIINKRTEINEENKENKKNTENKLTLSQILNIFDGISTPDGLFVICTTNHKEKFDLAFIRASRIDNDIEFPLCSIQQILDIYKSNYKEDFPIDKKYLLLDNYYYPSLLCNIFFEYNQHIAFTIMENEYKNQIKENL